MIITIDGPAGTGKSTAARELARALGIAYLDTGATYRAVTLAALRAAVDLTDERALLNLVRPLKLELEYDGDAMRVVLNGEDVSREIRSAEVSDNSHHVARAADVRELLVAIQRRTGRRLAEQRGGFVAEGRDQGSVVFPGADVKFYLDANPHVRARRRYDELIADGEEVEYDKVLDAVLTRDGRDRTRAIAPLVKPQGAHEIDTTDMGIAEVTAELLRLVREHK